MKSPVCAVLLFACACGSRQTEPTSAPTAEPLAEPAGESRDVAEPSPSEDPESPADPVAQAPEEGAAEADTPEPRQVLYRVTGEGLIVEIDGMRFEPSAEPVRYRGGWAVNVTVKATATDERTHSLLTPENGPLSFAAIVEKKGKTETIGDTREGEDDTFVTPGDTVELSRQFPMKGGSPLWGGQSLTLQVGLWGLGAEDKERYPVKKLFLLKMATGNHTPQPVIVAPK